jgi:hypothetical protein
LKGKIGGLLIRATSLQELTEQQSNASWCSNSLEQLLGVWQD